MEDDDVDVMISNIPLIVTGRPHASSTAYALATAIGYTHPYEFSDLADLANTIQHDYEGNASTDTPLTKEQMLDVLNKYGVKYIDMQDMIDTANTSQNFDEVRHNIAAMNKNAVLQIFLLKSDSKLALAINNPEFQTDPSKPPMVSGPLLHPWTQGDVPYCIVRSGFATDKNIGRYYDTLLSSSPIEMPTPITWQTITDSVIVACIAILPQNVEVPPADFRYFGGLDANGNAITNTWPLPHPSASLDVQALIQSVQQHMSKSDTTYSTQITQINQLASQIATSVTNVANLLNEDKQSDDEAFMSLLAQLGYKEPVSTQPVQPATPPTQAPTSTPPVEPTTQPVPDPTNGTGSQLI